MSPPCLPIPPPGQRTAILPGGSVGLVGRSSSARWLRRLVILVALAAAATALRDRKLAENAERYGLPG